MNNTEFRKQIEKIASDRSRPVDDRMEEILALIPDTDEDDSTEKEISVYSVIIDILWDECNDHSRDLTLLQLYVLLAEAYDDADNYRPMEKVAAGVLRLMRDRQTPAEIYKETIPRLTSAVGNSVYNHALYEMLMLYVKAVLKEDPEDTSIKSHAKKLIKLHLLLEPDPWDDCEWTKDFQRQLSSLFTSEELMQIIANPKIGHLRRDPVEYTHRWEQIYYDVEAALDERFMNAPRQMGLCFRIWNAKRELLKKEYGIDWHSPRQMNPGVKFD